MLAPSGDQQQGTASISELHRHLQYVPHFEFLQLISVNDPESVSAAVAQIEQLRELTMTLSLRTSQERALTPLGRLGQTV